MRALILAAGRGQRLGSWTAALPKGLVTLGGKPLLVWQIEALKEAGCTELAIVTGYQAEKLSFLNLIAFHNHRWNQTQMVQSLRCASAWLTETECLISYADILTSSACLQALSKAPGDVVISSNRHWQKLWTARWGDPLSDAETFACDAQGFLCEIGGRAKTLAEIEGQYMGLIKITPAAWLRIEAWLKQWGDALVDRLDMTSLFQRLLQVGEPIRVLPVEEPWLEVDTSADLQLYQHWLETGRLQLPLKSHPLW